MFKAAFFFVTLGWMFFSFQTAQMQAGEQPVDFNRANQAFSEDKFSEAAAIYDSLIKNQGASPELFFNLGNALARSGKIGHAVLAYERGLLLSPRDADIRANLEKIRQKNNLVEKPDTLWEQPFFLLSQNTWAVVLLFSVWTMALLLVVWILLRKKIGSGLAYGLLVSGILFTLTGLSGMSACLIYGERENRAVALTPDAPLQISPFAGASVSAVLRPGEIVRVGERHGDYSFVRNEEGKSGWVRMQTIEKIQ
jgi:tetratricopeptide (TPR) repeat protein